MIDEDVNFRQKRKFPQSDWQWIKSSTIGFAKSEIPITERLFKQKVLEAASSLKIENFGASKV